MAELSILRKSISALFGTSITAEGGITAQGIQQLPSDHGMKAWTAPLDQAASSSLMSLIGAGIMQGSRLRRVPPMTITNLHIGLSAAGVGLTNCFAAVYAADGSLLGVTADQATSWLSVGFKTIPLIAPVNHPGGDLSVGAWYGTGSTAPSPARIGNGSGGLNTSLQSAGNLSSFFIGTGLTTTPPPSVAAAAGNVNVKYWFGVS